MSTGRLGAGDTAIQPTIFDAKGDLLTATAGDTPARIAVGNNGETLVADSSASTGLRWQGDYAAGKNSILNADFRINQRAFTSTTTNATFGFDRWRCNFTDGTNTYSAETFTPGAAPVVGYEAINFARIVSTGQTLTGASTALGQRIEDVRALAGQTVTLSFWAKASTGTPNISVELGQNFGSGGSSTVTGSVASGTVKKFAITSSWVRYSTVLTVPSISGKTIGTGSYLFLNLHSSAGSDLNTRTDSLGIQSVTIDYWGVQLEPGSVATAFQTATGTLAGELAACQRYYLKSYNQATAPGTASNTVGNTGYSAISATSTNNRWNVRFPVNMRTTPTITVYSTSSGTSAKIYNEQAAVDVDAATQYIGESGFHLYTSSGTPTAGHQLLAHYVASAEL